jgi:UDP-2,3-diacylglucosamine pyrophosphatase LpxH
MVRLAVVSDTHFGDELCVLVEGGDDGDAPRVGPGYPAFREAVGQVDYLVLLGDIIDFSVASYERAYRDAKVFFTEVQRDGLARELIYVPGNHDFDIWSVVEHQVSVINQLKQGELPRPFERSVPGVIDAREPEPRLQLPDVAAHPEWHTGHSDYGGLFLDHITLRPADEKRRRGEGQRSLFNFAYPNLYLVTRESESILLTHGHYFEAYWTLLGEWVVRLAGDDLELESEGELSVRDLVGMNFPLNQLACTGVGQAHPLSDLARRLQLEAHAGRTGLIERYLEKLEEILVRRAPLGLRARLFRSWLARRARSRLVAALASAEQTRFSREFLSRPDVRERFRRYYRGCRAELERLRREHGLDLPPPRHVVFGHTHQPIPWGSDELTDTVDGHEVRLCNTGGWVLKEEPDGSIDFVGAEVVIYEQGRPIRSVSIRSGHLGAAVPRARPPGTLGARSTSPA